MRKTLFARSVRIAFRVGLIPGAVLIVNETAHAADLTEPPSIFVTNVFQLRQLPLQKTDTAYRVRLKGNVWWAKPAEGRIVLQDETGSAELEMNLADRAVQSGQRARIEGIGTIARKGAGFKLGPRGAVVDNNGVHGMFEKSGSIYLRAGRHPIRVDWFNGVEKMGLEVQFEGPSLPKQKIPEARLFRSQPGADGSEPKFVNGLDFRGYEVGGEMLPDFSRLNSVRRGTAAGFDISVRHRDEHVGVQFEGWLEVPRDGLYTFFLRSDDGSELFIGDPATLRLEAIGPATYPTPHPIAIGQTLRDEEDGRWSEVDGKVTFVRDGNDGLELELSAGAGRMRVEFADASGLSAATLMNARLRATGFCEGAITTDGQRIPGILLVPDGREIELLKVSTSNAGETSAAPGTLPVLGSAVEVHRLKREEAERGYPVRFRGVVTSVLPENQAFTIQDATRGLYVEDYSEDRSGPPVIGDFLEVEGTTDPGKFAPFVQARRVASLGKGHLPEPVRPTWDQLLNGSLDAQYVEIQGIVTAVQTNGVTLLTRGGVIEAELRVIGVKPEGLKNHENALVRIRGCLLASWDYLTHQVQAGRIRVNDADVIVDQPAPADLFSSPAKTLAELMLFDPQAGAFERVKVSGQIVCARDAELFLTDGRHGVRFIAKQTTGLELGDQAEVVGFPDLFGGAAPVLREAVARKIGHAPLPEARKLPPENLIRAEYDSTRVQVEGKLVSERHTRTDEILELQSGVRTFAARWNAADGSAPLLPIGSQLELTGIYAARGGNRAAGQEVASFELLLNSAADVRVLARPPWWTLQRLLVIVGALACVLAATMLWITQLHRKVTERTAELGAQIQERQRVEHQHAMEQERARIAQDLHDELGSGITEITMLAARAKSASALEEKRSGYLEQMVGRAREMVTALDEIVWAMNPRHDSLASLVSYFCLYAERFLGLANITWRLVDASGPPDHVLDSRQRHQLFLAFKEALTNIVRHSGASEVRLSVRVEQGQVRLTIADNGRGLAAGARSGEMDGLANMQSRLEKLGGRFEMSSEAGRGTTLKFLLPSNGTTS